MSRSAKMFVQIVFLALSAESISFANAPSDSPRYDVNRLPNGNFRGTATWSRTEDQPDYGFLKLEGIRMDAVETAIRHCLEAGYTHCELKSTDNQYWNRQVTLEDGSTRLFTQFAAIVQGADSQIAGANESATFTADPSFNSTRRHGQLHTLGIKMNSLNEAMSNCYAQGYINCVYLAVSLGTFNQRRTHEPTQTSRYYTSARATVKGYHRPNRTPAPAVEVEETTVAPSAESPVQTTTQTAVQPAQ